MIKMAAMSLSATHLFSQLLVYITLIDKLNLYNNYSISITIAKIIFAFIIARNSLYIYKAVLKYEQSKEIEDTQ